MARHFLGQRPDFGVLDAQHGQSVERQAVQELGNACLTRLKSPP